VSPYRILVRKYEGENLVDIEIDGTIILRSYILVLVKMFVCCLMTIIVTQNI
jgi:hypothetical protein